MLKRLTDSISYAMIIIGGAVTLISIQMNLGFEISEKIYSFKLIPIYAITFFLVFFHFLDKQQQAKD